MTGNQSLGIESSAVQHHLTLLQGIIQRMAENSRSCKSWCITIVAAVLVLVARTEQPDYALIALLPASLTRPPTSATSKPKSWARISGGLVSWWCTFPPKQRTALG